MLAKAGAASLVLGRVAGKNKEPHKHQGRFWTLENKAHIELPDWFGNPLVSEENPEGYRD